MEVEKTLRRLEGVASVRVALAEKAAYVRLKAGVPFEPEKFRAALEKRPEKVRGFELRLRATVERRAGRDYLRPAGVAQRFAVAGRSSVAKLEPLVGRVVRARGKLVSRGSSPLELELTEIAPQ